MRRFSTILTLLLLLSFCVTAAAPLALADEAKPVREASTLVAERTVITWTPAALALTVAPGETEHARASFTSRIAIGRASLVVSFPLNRYVKVEPRGPLPVVAGATYPVELTVTMPDDMSSHGPSVIAGTIQVVGHGQSYQLPLLVIISRANPRPPVQWTPTDVKLAVDAPATASAPALGTTTTVSFTTGVTITNARIRPTPPLNRVFDLSETGPIMFTPGVTYTLVMTAHQPLATDALEDETADIERGSARRVVSGLVEIFDAHRVYPRTLPVTVVLAPVPAAPVITWRPPLVNLRLDAGQAATQIVTMTSNITVEKAILRVTGAITLYLTAQTGGAAPFTLLPHTAYPVTLSVISPPTSMLNRPLSGSVLVVDGSGRVLRQDLKVTVMWRRQPTSPAPTPTAIPTP